MDSDEIKHAVLKEFDAAKARQTEEIRDAKVRDEIRKSRVRHFFRCVIAALCFGWIAFLIGKMNRIAVGFQIPTAAAFGAALAFAYSVRKERILREESTLIRRVLSLAGFKSNYDRTTLRAFIVFGSLFVLISVGVPIAENHYPHAPLSRFIDRYFLYILGAGFASVFAIFYVSFAKLHRVHCPQCNGRLRVRSYRPELTNTHSGLCKTCGILWDLDVGNSDSD